MVPSRVMSTGWAHYHYVKFSLICNFFMLSIFITGKTRYAIIKIKRYSNYFRTKLITLEHNTLENMCGW